MIRSCDPLSGNGTCRLLSTGWEILGMLSATPFACALRRRLVAGALRTSSNDSVAFREGSEPNEQVREDCCPDWASEQPRGAHKLWRV